MRQVQREWVLFVEQIDKSVEESLRQTVRTGVLPRPLLAVFLTLRTIYAHDTHEQEGVIIVCSGEAIGGSCVGPSTGEQ